MEQEVMIQDRSLFVCRVIALQVAQEIAPLARVRGKDLDMTDLLANTSERTARA
jgi:hypothetical protein